MESDDDQKKLDPRDSSALSSADNSFAGFVDTYEDEDEAVNVRMIQGTRIKFTNEAKWVNAQGVKLDPQLSLIVVEVKRVVNKWPVTLGPPLETQELSPGQHWPNIKKLNEACPQSEWRTDFNGNPKGPYEGQRLLYLVDPVTLDKYTYATSTVGGTRALTELVDKIAWAQEYRRCPGIRPIVQLATTWMPTKYSGRMRPHFIVLPDWILPNGGRGELVQKPVPQIGGPGAAAAKLDALADKSDPAAKPATQAAPQTGPKPSLAEEIKDTIAF